MRRGEVHAQAWKYTLRDNAFPSIQFDTDVKRKDTFLPFTLVPYNWDLQERAATERKANQQLSIHVTVTAELFCATLQPENESYNIRRIILLLLHESPQREGRIFRLPEGQIKKES